MTVMDPEYSAILDVMGQLSLDDPQMLRDGLAALAAEPESSPAVATTDLSITAADGTALAARLYEPVERDGAAPGLAYFHGGAFILGDLDTEHAKCLRHAEGATVVLSVDYRLAPEHPFPTPPEDCYAGLQWLADHSDDLGVDASRLAVGGSSAGGGLSAAVAQMARDRGGPPVAFQLLVYPVTDDRLETTSMGQFRDLPGWNGRASEQMWDHYLGSDRTDVSPYAAPARATDLSGLPPAYVLTAEFDPLRDEGVAYALALLRAGVRTELHQFPGVPHGFDLFAPDAPAARRAIIEQVAVLRAALAP